MMNYDNYKNKCIEVFRKIEIKKRLILIYVVICVVPIITVGSYTHREYERSITSKLGETTSQVLMLLAQNIQKELERYTYIGSQIVMHPMIQKYLSEEPPLSEMRMREVQLELNSFLNEKVIISEMVQGVYILDDEGKEFYSMGYEIMDSDFLKKIAGKTDQAAPLEYNTVDVREKKNDRIIFSRVIYSEDGSARKKGYIVIAVNESVFRKKTYMEVKLNQDTQICILNSQGELISASSTEIRAGELLDLSGLARQLRQTQDKKMLELKLNHEKYTAVYEYEPIARWYIVSFIPESYINSEVAAINVGIFIISLLCMGFAVLILSLITASIDGPIKKLVKETQKITDGDFAVPLEDTHRDEMAFLSGRFREMVIQVNELRQKDQIANQKKRELEIQMLQAQINPHFLFNTLNSLKWIAMMSRIQILADGLDALAQLLRGTISEKRELIPLKQELAYLEKYFLIQRLRYSDSFSVSYEIQEELREKLIIKFLLQPIVENSILHGASKEKSKVHIKIKASKEDGIMRIVLEDDGQGFLTEQAGHAQEDENYKKFSGIGMDNVRERIEINFGSPYTMRIESRVGTGTKVSMILPIIDAEEKEDV